MKPEPISDIALVRAFTAARKTLPLADALRAVVEAANQHLVGQLPQVIATVVAEVSHSTGVPVEDLTGPTRDTGSLWHARRACWWILHRRFKVSFEDIGRAFSGRHRTTICKVLDRMRQKVCDDPNLRMAIDQICASVARKAA